ncbi:MAG: UDP-N-acetylmuramate dehydrogenase [Nitrospirota bacterium]|nr:UDP-N-acetylmuramate dehydrogenase [Nitrospirota bacterium]
MEPMSDHTSLRIGGPAEVFTVPQDLISLKNMRLTLKREQIPFFTLGGGTNILVRDGGMEGAVISFNSFRKIEVLSEDDEYVQLSVETGTPLQRLVNFSKENGYSGLEGLVGIPGTVGGAIVGNAGAFGYEMKDVLVLVEIMNAEGEIGKCKAEKIDFGYRRSSISSAEVILSAEIRLKKDKKKNVSTKVEDFLQKKWKQQPISESSAGCVFKNPPELYAGMLIDEVGCKGMRIGDVEVSTIHANFFINKGRATASDFLHLINEVAHRVKEKFGVVLEPEIKIIGKDVN